MSNQIGISQQATDQALPVSALNGLRNAGARLRPVLQPLARYVRWRFDYTDHKPSKCGQWCRPGTMESDIAAFQSKENLLRAAIEVKSLRTGQVRTIVECDGPNFVNFTWLAGSPAGIGIGLKGTRQLPRQILGLGLVTRDEKCIVLMDGSDPKTYVRTDQDKARNLAGFGK